MSHKWFEINLKMHFFDLVLSKVMKSEYRLRTIFVCVYTHTHTHTHKHTNTFSKSWKRIC